MALSILEILLQNLMISLPGINIPLSFIDILLPGLQIMLAGINLKISLPGMMIPLELFCYDLDHHMIQVH